MKVEETKVRWEDMSDYLVHFTKDFDGATAYENSLSILSLQTIQARTPFGLARQFALSPEGQRTACFSEVPLHELNRLAQRRGPHGLGFPKQVVRKAGGVPVWYAYARSPANLALLELVRHAKTAGEADHPIWKIAPFVDAPGEYSGKKYFFEWEREWRVAGDFNFTIGDVAFLVMPEDLHEAARSFFETAVENNSGPGYFCPFIDASWDKAKISEVLGVDTSPPS